MMLLAEGKTSEAWKPSKNQCSFGNCKALDKKIILLSSLKVSMQVIHSKIVSKI
jgi:hypothetical protein